ncbi:MAG: HD domain-containing protein [Blastocatellia bacterium]|nr:HD domain-containing protein [Blastocatellia bacterium]
MIEKVIRDAVHGDMVFTNEEMELIDTPQMQRLRGIKQLGTSSLVYLGAIHTRFEHSLGTCWTAKKILEAIKSNHIASGKVVPFDRQIEKTIVAAALLHDITHIPYGHTFEDERRIFERHDENKNRLFHFLDSQKVKTALKRQGVYDEVVKILTAQKGKHSFLYQIVAGTVCADLLDYLKRDSFFCGLSHFYDKRIFRYFNIYDGEFVVELQKDGLFRHDALSELINLLRIRYTLTERVYYHHAKVVAGAMISKAVEIAVQQSKLKLEDLFDMKDDSLLYVLRSKSRSKPVANLIEAVENRHLYKRVYLVSLQQKELNGGITQDQQKILERDYHFNQEDRRGEAENLIRQELGLPEGGVIVYCPSASMALKEAKVPVKVDEQPPRSLAEFLNPEVSTLIDKHRSLWRFFVCISKDYEEKFEKASKLCEEIFGHPNMIKMQTRGQLSFNF